MQRIAQIAILLLLTFLLARCSSDTIKLEYKSFRSSKTGSLYCGKFQSVNLQLDFDFAPIEDKAKDLNAKENRVYAKCINSSPLIVKLKKMNFVKAHPKCKIFDSGGGMIGEFYFDIEMTIYGRHSNRDIVKKYKDYIFELTENAITL